MQVFEDTEIATNEIKVFEDTKIVTNARDCNQWDAGIDWRTRRL